MKKLLLILFAFALAGNVAWGQTLPDNWTGDSGIDTYQSSNAHSGSYSCKVVVNTGTQSNCDFNNSTSISVTAGNSFTVKFWYQTSAHVKGRLHLLWTGASAAYASYTVAGASSWTEFTYSGTVPTGATALSVGIRFYDQSGFSAPETQYIDDVTFESPTGTSLTVTNGDMESWPAPPANDQTSVVEAPASQIAAGTISSLKTASADAVNVFTMKIVDKASGDGLPTHVTNIRIKPGANNTADWTNTIKGVTLNDGSAVSIGSPTITDTYIDIPITSGNLDIADGASKEVTLAVYLNTSNIEDGNILAFKVDASSPGFTADASGSGFASSFSADVVSNNFTLAVVGTQLSFSNVPSSVAINTDFSTTVSATDANGNVDKDDATSVTLSKNTGSGILSSATGLSQSLSSGTYTWNDLQYNTAETFKMAANGGSYSEILTNDITASSPPKLIISEVADPKDHYQGRFVELYNVSSSAIDLDAGNWYLSKQVNGGSWYNIALSGTIQPGETFVVANNTTDFNNYYGFDADQYSTTLSGNGDDGYYLYYGGNHSSGTLIDAYGVPDEDGTGKPWEYTDSHAVRLPDVTGPNATWTSGEWVITGANVADMTPSVYKAAFTWAGSTSADWGEKANWTIGGSAAPSIPDVSCTVTIPSGTTNGCSVTGTPAFESDAYAITISSGASLTIPAGNVLSAANITNSAGASGLIIQSTSSGNGSLVVHGSVTGDATVQRYVAGYTAGSGTGNGWHEIGCPVQSMDIASTTFAPSANDDLYKWDETAADGKNWRNYKASTFNFSAGNGYLIAHQGETTYSYTGALNTGSVTVNGLSYGGTGSGWQLLGNPYPSAIQWNNGGWTLTNVGGVAEIWDEASASYVAVNAGDIIPSTNGFFVQVSGGTGSVTIPADARVHDATNNFKEVTATPKETLTFKITDDANTYSDGSILGFKPNATEDWDMAFDAHKLMSLVKTAPQIWTVSKDQNFLVNYIPETTLAYDIPLHFHAGVNTVYHLTIKGADSFNGTSFVLEDLKTGKEIDLNNTDSYDFSADKNDDVNRFVLHINGVMAVPSVNETDNIQVFAYGNTVYLHGQKVLNGKIFIFNTLGQKVYEGLLNGAAKQQIRLNQRTGIYFVRLEENNHVFTQKVFIK